MIVFLVQTFLFMAVLFFVVTFLVRAFTVIDVRRREPDDHYDRYDDYDDDDDDDEWEPYEDDETDRHDRVSSRWKSGMFRRNAPHTAQPLDDAPAETIANTAREVRMREEHLQQWTENGLKDIERFLTPPQDPQSD